VSDPGPSGASCCVIYLHENVIILQTRNVFKKDKRRRIKKGKKVRVHQSYTDDGKPRMLIVKVQWTAFMANFVRK